ncbi:MAG: M23 family metallopeptidase, partial [Desulfotomaculales bacterium]
MLLPYIIPAALVLLLLLFLSLVIVSIFSVMAPERYLTGVEPSKLDKEIEARYNRLCGEYTVADTWVVNREPNRPENGNGKYESSRNDPFHPGGGVENLHRLADKGGKDARFRLTLGQVHAAALYRAYVDGWDEIPDSYRQTVARGLHPYFYYKKSTVIVTVFNEDGTESTYTYIVYLLVEAYTIQGHFQYHYEWRTECGKRGCVTYEALVKTVQILPD